jgi:predicted site-specific integrase-resolvase
MAKKDIITFKKSKNGTFTIIKNENFAHLMAVSFAFHSKYMESLSEEKGQIIQEGPRFLALMERLSTADEKVSLSLSEVKILNEWVKCITEIIIAIPSTDLKDKNMQTFFRLSQDFVTKTNNVI